jgi:hypothetical protein
MNQTETINSNTEQAVIIKFYYHSIDLKALHELEDKLEDHLNHTGIGEFDGNEIDLLTKKVTIYMYGTNARTIFNSIEAILNDTDFMKNAQVTLRFGPPEKGIKEIQIIV